MSQCRYEITMKTSIGLRHGMMSVDVKQSRINGMLYILKRANPFCGTIDENGVCRISGEIATLVRTISYVASGTMTGRNVQLKLQGGRAHDEISGTALPPAPEEEKEFDV